ncbi:MAG TPA: transglutaminase domain-containing protein, partial [Bacteroidales bacterium]|nr:transglutaminase domain-containing protein [Bacteroidales bacterium]
GEMAMRQLADRAGVFTEIEKAEWESLSWLECRTINGEKMYFNRAASNLKRILDFHYDRAMRDSAEARDPEMVERKIHTQAIIRESSANTRPVMPEKIKITYTLTVRPGEVPAGEIVRCWLPYPKENHPRQRNVKLISVSHPRYVISPDTAVHKTLYLEAAAEEETPLVFQTEFSYEASGQYFDPDRITVLPYDRSSALYRKYTSEHPPQIRFTDTVRKVADSIAGSEESPLEIVRKMYHWFSDNIPWAGALEYSIMPDIPGYVIKNRRGDCGMQTLLLMSMLRYKGIPVRWQSGWKVPPGYRNLHDWCEVWFEGTGWVPLDISYGLQYSNDRRTREFYITGIDSWRLIVNDGISGALCPEKKFMRSEPYDFQRGEVEWRGGNLYFDKWDYQMKIEYGK